MFRLRHLVNRVRSGVSTFPPSVSSAIPSRKSALSRIVKVVSVGTLGALSGVAYVTYAYTYEELCEKTREFARPPEYENSSPSAAKSVFTVAANAAIDYYLDVRYITEEVIRECFSSPPDKILPDLDVSLVDHKLYTLVLDLNETLVHSDWKKTAKLESERGGETYKRPGMDAFLKHMFGIGYEVVVYTDEINLTIIRFILGLEDISHIHHILTTKHNELGEDGERYRNLAKLNRDPSRILYVSAHALENCLQPENCVPIKPWKKEVDDTSLTDLVAFLEYVAYTRPDDIRPLLSSLQGKDITTEFKRHPLLLEAEEMERLPMEIPHGDLPWKAMAHGG